MVLGVVPPDEHAVLVFLVQVSLLLGLARVAGGLARRVGQPAVVGELVAGVIAGPSLFGRVLPGAFEWTFGEDTESAMVFALAWLGLLLLLGVAGVESDLDVVRQLGRPAALVTAGSLLVPLAGGFGLGLVAPAELVGPTAGAIPFALFLAVALSISSLPVVARVLTELGMVRRDVGQLVLAVAVANDVIGWLLLGFVVGIAGPGDDSDPGALVVTMLAVAVFGVAAFSVGRLGVDRSLRRAAGRGSESHVGLMVGIVAIGGAITQAIGVEAVVGAFVAGLVIGRSRWRDERAIAALETITTAVLAPLFFATAGLRIDLAVFTDPTVAFWSLVIIAVASVTKLAGAGVGALAARLPRREAQALGVGLNARGALEIVIASIGLSLGILTEASYGAVVIMAIVTSIAAPPLLRRLLRDWPGTEAEQRRLAAEESARRRVVLSARPPLLLTRGRPGSIAAAEFVHGCWPPHHPVTILTTVDRERLRPIQDVLADRAAQVLSVDEDQDRLLAETQRGYSAVVLGVNERPGESLLGPLHRRILAETGVPIVIVRRERITGNPLPASFASVLVPVTDSHTSRAALELATGMAASLGTRLVLAHIVTDPGLFRPRHDGVQTAEPALRSAVESARAAGVQGVTTLSRTADNPAAELNRLGLELGIDLIVAGTTINEDRLGPTATFLLEHAPISVAVVATPPGWVHPLGGPLRP